MFISILVEQMQRNLGILVVVFGVWLVIGFVAISLVALYFRLKGDKDGLREIQNGQFSKAFHRLDEKR